MCERKVKGKPQGKLVRGRKAKTKNPNQNKNKKKKNRLRTIGRYKLNVTDSAHRLKQPLSEGNCRRGHPYYLLALHQHGRSYIINLASNPKRRGGHLGNTIPPPQTFYTAGWVIF